MRSVFLSSRKSHIRLTTVVFIFAFLATCIAHSLHARSFSGGGASLKGTISVPGVKTLHDISYGNSAKQKIDVYIPPNATNSPILVMVHGGGWRMGDKQMTGVITNKGNHYLSKGFIFISVNYRLVPEADALNQANDVAAAIAYIEMHAHEWGGNPDKLILMGHSSGAHLVGLLGADPSRVIRLGGKRWAGTIPLDSAAMDVPGIMQRQHRSIYDDAFGANPNGWAAASPLHQVKVNATPLFLICSSNRKDSCPPTHALGDKAKNLGVMALVHEEALNHGKINSEVGLDGPYTDTIDSFIQNVITDHH